MDEFHSVTTLLRSRALHDSSKLAYSFLNDELEGDAHLTYAELDRRSRAVAAVLERRGARGERVLLLYPPGLDFLIGFFGCLFAGAIAVPAHPPKPRRTDARIREIALDSGANLALSTRNVLTYLGGEARAGEAAGCERLEWLATDEIDLESTGGGSELEPAKDEIAYLQYTSGSTSTPKGVMVSHGNLWHNLTALWRRDLTAIDLGLGSGEHNAAVTWLPHYHDMGLVYGLLLPLYTGFPCQIMSPVSFLQQPERWLKAMTIYRGTHSGGPNFAYELCVRRVPVERRGSFSLSTWRVAVNGGEPLRKETFERFQAAFRPSGFRPQAFYPAYGLAEATLLVTSVFEPTGALSRTFDAGALGASSAVPAESGIELVSSGRPNFGMEVAIVNPVTGRRHPNGGIGEIWVRGGSVAAGYWNKPDETLDVFGAVIRGEDSRAHLRTGDLGFINEDELFVTGRVKDIIIIRGRNHYPHDIEATVEKCHSWLRPHCGAAFSIDAEGEERLVIVQEVERQYHRRDMAEPLREIRRAVAEEHEISPYAVVLISFGKVPKTTSGKIRRQTCRELWVRGEFEPLGERREAPVPADAPGATRTDDRRPRSKSEIESFMIECLCVRAQLAAEEIDVGEPFANYGLDSVDALELMADLEEFTDTQISPMLFWNYPTVAALAGHLAGMGNKRADC